jgi:hypothetical protein
MLRLESSAIGEIVGGTMLPALVDRLIELDVCLLSSCQIFSQGKARSFDHYSICLFCRWKLDGMARCSRRMPNAYLKWI